MSSEEAEGPIQELADSDWIFVSFYISGFIGIEPFAFLHLLLIAAFEL